MRAELSRSGLKRPMVIGFEATPSAHGKRHCPERLVREEWNDDLWHASAYRGSGCSRSAVVNNGRHLREEPCVISLGDVKRVVWHWFVRSPDHNQAVAAMMRCLSGPLGDIRGRESPHAAEGEGYWLRSFAQKAQQFRRWLVGALPKPIPGDMAGRRPIRGLWNNAGAEGKDGRSVSTQLLLRQGDFLGRDPQPAAQWQLLKAVGGHVGGAVVDAAEG